MEPDIFVKYLVVCIYGIIAGGVIEAFIYYNLSKPTISLNLKTIKKSFTSLICYVFFCINYKKTLYKGYILLRFLNAVLCILIFSFNGFCIKSVLYSLFAAALLIVAVIDWKIYEIPVSINIFIFFIGIINAAISDEKLIFHVIGLFSVSFPLLILYIFTKGNAMGGGDIKLMAVAGFILGGELTLAAFFIGCVLAAIIQTALMKIFGKDNVFALGPYLSAGNFIVILFGRDIMMWLS